ncbi:MAG TPA: hypothetical protein VMM57_05355 [Bacteroidota bacterium]|nr:hypothetical protein [Bacteroidota bacterium]
MRRFTMRGLSLFDSHNRKIAITEGKSIYDADDKKAAGQSQTKLRSSDPLE